MCSVDDKKDFQVPAMLKLLQDPCIWIIDTSATSNLTAHCVGLINLKTVSSNDDITMGNNLVSKATEIGVHYAGSNNPHIDRKYIGRQKL
jgi:hypothetical protein